MKESQEVGPEKYTAVVGGRTFILSQTQIERDSPNYFTSYFLNPSNHGPNRITKLEIYRDPDAFELVLRYLNGYNVMPIEDRFVPAGSTPETTLANLRVDAEFYQLRGLIELCSPEEKEVELVTSYVMITGFLWMSKDGLSPVEDLSVVAPRFSISPLGEDMYNEATKDMFTITNETASVPNYLLVSSWSNHIVREVLSKLPSVKRWEIMGWKRTLEGDARHALIFVRLHSLPGSSLK